jgi:hypothetical protein
MFDEGDIKYKYGWIDRRASRRGSCLWVLEEVGSDGMVHPVQDKSHG